MALLETRGEHIITDRDHRHKGGVGGLFFAALALAAAGGAYASNVGGVRERLESLTAHSDDAVAGQRNAPPQAVERTFVAPVQTEPIASPIPDNDPYAGYRRPGPARVLDMAKVASCASARNQHDRGRWEHYDCPGEM